MALPGPLPGESRACYHAVAKGANVHAHQIPLVPLSRDKRHIVTFLAVVAITACGGAPAVPPTSPSPPLALTTPLPPSRTVTGSVWLSSPTAPQPLTGVVVGIWLERPHSGGPVGSVKSDSAGRFSFETPADALVRLYSRPQGFYQPCLSTVRVDQTEATIRLVAESHLLQARDWPDFAVERRLSGTIFEASPAGRLPIADAWVQVDGVMGDGRPLADTRSDATGRFVVCGLERETQIPHALVVSKPGYQYATAGVPTQGGGPVDVELRLCTADRPRLEGGWCQP